MDWPARFAARLIASRGEADGEDTAKERFDNTNSIASDAERIESAEELTLQIDSIDCDDASSPQIAVWRGDML